MAKILVADDSWLIRQMVGKVLKANGHEVEEVDNGRRALERAIAEPPDCILLDLLMPELSGFEVLEGLREQKLAVPVVVLSADIQDTSRNRCLELGAQ
ncbi:response regulator transcription factor [Candidatus Sumerlaeota bacterium]